jgi:hypothetical protein
MTAVKIPTLSPEVSPIHWMLPAEKRSLADTFLAAEVLLYKVPDASENTLRSAFHHFTAYLAHTGMMDRNFASLATGVSMRLDSAGLRAALARTNCQLLRMLSALPMCPLRCCCTCHLPPKDVTCCRWMTNLGEQNPEGLIDPMPPGVRHG